MGQRRRRGWFLGEGSCCVPLRVLTAASTGLVCGAFADGARAQQGGATASGSVSPAIFANPSGKHLRVADLPPPRRFVTQHTGTARDRSLACTATAGVAYITNTAGEPVATLFAFTPVKSGPADPPRLVRDREVDPRLVLQAIPTPRATVRSRCLSIHPGWNWAASRMTGLSARSPSPDTRSIEAMPPLSAETTLDSSVLKF